jgi:hypothetical protein
MKDIKLTNMNTNIKLNDHTNRNVEDEVEQDKIK